MQPNMDFMKNQQLKSQIQEQIQIIDICVKIQMQTQKQTKMKVQIQIQLLFQLSVCGNCQAPFVFQTQTRGFDMTDSSRHINVGVADRRPGARGGGNLRRPVAAGTGGLVKS